MANMLPKPKVGLVGQDGNAYNILGLCQTAAREAGWSPEQWNTVRQKMIAGNYDHLLATAQEYFDTDAPEESEDKFCCANCLNEVSEADDVCGNCGHSLTEE